MSVVGSGDEDDASDENRAEYGMMAIHMRKR